MPSDPTLTYPDSDMVFSLSDANFGVDIISIGISSATDLNLSYITASTPGSDLNGDGWPDWLLGVNSIASNGAGVQVLLNDTQGSGIVVYSATYPTGAALGDGPSAIVTADVDSDGTLDIITANGPDGTVSVLLNDGSGHFSPAQLYPAGAGADLLTADDVNGDGYPDIVVLDKQAGSVSVLLNNGDGTFTPGTSAGVGSGMGSMQLVDLNDDGNLDLVTVDAGDGALSVLLNNGDGTFTPMVQYSSSIGASSMYGLVDVNGDGYLDLAILNGQDETVLANNGDGTFAAEAPLNPGEFATDVVFACSMNIAGPALCQTFLMATTDGVESGGTVTMTGMGGPTMKQGHVQISGPVIKKNKSGANGGGALDGLSLFLLGGLFAVRRRKR
jgi:hypothetical protein